MSIPQMSPAGHIRRILRAFILTCGSCAAACTSSSDELPSPSSAASGGLADRPEAGASAFGGGGAASGASGASGANASSAGAAEVHDAGASALGGGGATSGSAGGSGMASTGGAGATGCNWLTAADHTLRMNPAVEDKLALFDGADLSQWHRLNQPETKAQWQVLPEGVLEVVPQQTPTNIQSNATFDDVCLHVEYWTPAYATGVGVQMQGNSGVYLKSAYEMQVLDTSQLGKLIDGCGAVYKVSPPLAVACTPHETWNTYEIEFTGSVWDNHSPPLKTKDAAFVQVALNGQLVQRNVTLNLASGATEAGIAELSGPQPIALQDHRERVRYRNIWATVPRY